MFNLVLIVINLFFYLADFFKYYDGTEWVSPGDDAPDGYNWWIRLAIMLAFVFLALGLCIAGLPLITMISSLSMALSLKADVIKDNGPDDEESTGEKFGFITTLLSSILYKGQVLMALFSFDMIIDSFMYLNNNYGVGCIIAILFLYFVSPLFKQYKVEPSPENSISKCELNGSAYEKAVAYNEAEGTVLQATSLTQKTKDWTKSKASSASSGIKAMTPRSSSSGGSIDSLALSPRSSFDEESLLPNSRRIGTGAVTGVVNNDMLGGKKLPKRKGVSAKK